MLQANPAKQPMMFAYRYRRYGPPEVLEKVSVPKPSPKPHEVLVQIHATTVSAADWRLRSLTMPAGLGWIGRLAVGVTGPRKPVLGTDFSGVVVDVGTGVTQFRTGDAVIGFPGADLGAHAEFIVMPEDGRLALKPDTLSHSQAAAIPFGGTTAYDYLVNKGKLRAGERVLINGASGATGTACVQIAKHIGAHVTAVCSAGNAPLLRDLGADCVLDYARDDFSKQATKYDVVVDAKGTAPWARTRHALLPRGRMLLIAGHAWDMVFGPVRARIAGKTLIAGVAQENRDILRAVVALGAQGVFTPVIDARFSCDQMIAAHRRVDSGHKVGNVVVVPRVWTH